jgi:uncharacterized protein
VTSTQVAAANAVIPTQPKERIATLDILRALGLLGILVMNMPAFSEPLFVPQKLAELWPAWWDRASLWVMDAFFAGKFNSLFSFLFGVGFSIQMERLAGRGAKGTPVYLRRLLWLFVFGVVHALLIWSGDILHLYAQLGLVLLVIRKAPDKVMLALLALALLLPTMAGVYFAATATPESIEKDRAEITALAAAERDAYGDGAWREGNVVRLRSQIFMYSDPRPFLFGYPQLILTMLLGFHVGRKLYIQQADERREFIRKVWRWTLAIGTSSAIGFAVVDLFVEPFTPSPLNVLSVALYSLARPALMLFYAATAIRLYWSAWGKRWLYPLTYAGRMPLTNYLMQSVVCTLIFYNYGLGLYGKLGPAVWLMLAFLIFGIQVVASQWWFKRFRFGPAEWLWRVLTYLKAPRMRLADGSVALPASDGNPDRGH